MSIADIQWVLHHVPASGTLEAEVSRGEETRTLSLSLDDGWRRRSDISWRATSWDLRRMAFGGMLLKEMTPEERHAAGLTDDGMALRVEHVGQYGEHAVARNAGVQPGDIIVSYDGLKDDERESDLLAYAMQRKSPGDKVSLTLLRDGRRKTVTIQLR